MGVVLARQAKELSEKAKKAISQVASDAAVVGGATIDGLDRPIFEPYLSTYSMSSRTETTLLVGPGAREGGEGGDGAGSGVDGGTSSSGPGSSDMMSSRKRIREVSEEEGG